MLASLCRIFAEGLELHYRTWAKSVGHTDTNTGAVTFVHRFGSSLNLHTHFHVLVLDGVYVKHGDGVAFLASPAPTLEALVKRVVLRTMKWLKRKGYVGIGKAEAAARLPKAGRVVPEKGRADIREVFVRTYRIVYRVREDSILVLTVFEGHRLFPLRRGSHQDKERLVTAIVWGVTHAHVTWSTPSDGGYFSA